MGVCVCVLCALALCGKIVVYYSGHILYDAVSSYACYLHHRICIPMRSIFVVVVVLAVLVLGLLLLHYVIGHSSGGIDGRT